MATYCGNNALDADLVAGRVVSGNRYECLRKGIGVGRNLPVDLKYAEAYAPLDPTRRYCGLNDDLPDGYDDFGTRGDCLRNGIGMGKRMAAVEAFERGVRPVRARLGKRMLTFSVLSVVLAAVYFSILYFTKPDIITKNVGIKREIVWGKFLMLYLPTLAAMVVILHFIGKRLL
jgi:hypothetical protein